MVAAAAGLALGSLGWGAVTALRSGDQDASAPTTSTLSPTTVAERRALERFEEEMEAIAKEGGRVIQLGLKAGIGELDRGEEGEPEAFAERARAWEAELRGYRRDLAALDVPPFLRSTEPKRLEAMDGYIEIARMLSEAAFVTGDERDALLDEAVETGERADDVWEEADAAITHHRRRLGLTVTTLPPVVEPEDLLDD